LRKNEVIKIGRDVLETEAKAVMNLATRMDESFTQAVDLLFKSKSRTIVIGMGKSGLIGRKIAATLASCGTPAIFIHPAEAGHGDLGMILKDDVILAISYSGETREIVDLLNFIKRIGVKLITITGNKHSRLGRYSDVVLDAEVEREAGPIGLVPTASSTAALALGDALAIALMKRRGFNERDFAFVHPKGQTGKKILRVSTLMHKGRGIPRVRMDTSMREVIDEMSEKKLGMTCVVNDKMQLVGIVTDGDLRRALEKFGRRIIEKTAGDCMTYNPITIAKSDLATKALNVMEENKITSLIIKNKKGKIEGIIHLHDLWRTEMF
jgi:arabinose-5-phosphate isomerase